MLEPQLKTRLADTSRNLDLWQVNSSEEQPAMHAEQRVARAKLGPAVQKARLSGSPEHKQRVGELQRDYRAIAAEAYLKHVVDAAPPLTAAQRDRLALLLRGGAE